MTNNLFLKRKTLLVLSIFAFTLLTILYSCASDNSTSDDDDETPDYVSAKGFGDSNEEPEGTPFILPAGITLENIYVRNHFEETDCDGKHLEGPRGRETLVPLCLVFRNNTNGPINIELPPGLIFVCQNIKTQNGILSEGLTIEVPSDQYMVSPIRAYCLNDTRTIPGLGSDYKYKIGPVTKYKPMLDLFDKLKTKKIVSEIELENQLMTPKIQGFVWNLTHKAKLDSYNQKILDEIPNK